MMQELLHDDSTARPESFEVIFPRAEVAAVRRHVADIAEAG